MSASKKGFFNKKKSSFKSNGKEHEKKIKIIGVLLFIVSLFTLIALVSYSYEDESIIQMNVSELAGLVTGDEVAQIKAESVNNWLGLVGAYISYHIYNHTFGFIAILLPIILGRWSWELVKENKISKQNIRDTLYYFFGALAFAGLMGTVFSLEWISPFPKEWAGSIGLYLSYLTSNLLGSVGAFILFILLLATSIILGFNLKVDEILSKGINAVESMGMQIKKVELPNLKKADAISKDKKIKKEEPDKKESKKDKDFRINKLDEVENPTEEYFSDRSLNLNYKEGDEPEITEKEPPAYERRTPPEVNSSGEDSLQLTKEEQEPEETDEEAEQFKRAENPVSLEDLDDEPDSPICTYIHDEKINYNLPNYSLLDQNYQINEVNEQELKDNADILREKLATFKIEIENLSVTPGPVVTQYEFVPAAGIKISKIENLSDDLAMALKAKGIRIIAPIPGKGTVGIEIPNLDPSLVTFSSVVNTKKYRDTNLHLPLALGKTISGDVYIADLAKMPHLLIAGSTGSGKSVGINTILTSLLYNKKPDELKFVIVDPKKVELTHYSALADHYLASTPDVDDLIITEPSEAVIILKSLVMEMEERYNILSNIGERNIHDYNVKVKQGKYDNDPKMKHRRMPYIVCVIDELADLMLTAGKEIEEPIIRLAQMARAVGIHMILATQRPSVDVITGIIKANFPARMGYLVASKIDSRTILDMSGAEKLLGNGDMLYLSPGSPKPTRIQNSYITTDEVERICNFIGEQKGYSMPYQLPSLRQRKEEHGGIDPSERDELFEEAARVIITQQQGSVSLLQRKLKIGYARAGKIVDELEAAGVVGPYNGSKARDVLMESISELESVL